jgi:hypothetical protein
MNDAKELVQYHDSEESYILSILKRTYKMIEKRRYIQVRPGQIL